MQSKFFKSLVAKAKSFGKKAIEVIKKPVQAIGSFISSIDWANIKVDTYVRYALMILSGANTLLTHFGKNPIPYSEEGIYQVLTDIFTILVLIVNTYKDNPTSKESIDCTELQRAMKASEDIDEIRDMLQAKLDELNEISTSDTKETVEEESEDTGDADTESCEGDEEEV